MNTHYAEIDGVAAVGSLGQLPFVPELVVITAPAAAIPGLIEEAGARGAAGAVIITSGLGHGAGSLAEAAEERRAQIWHEADRAELPRHHHARRRSQRQFLRAHATAREIWR